MIRALVGPSLVVVVVWMFGGPAWAAIGLGLVTALLVAEMEDTRR